MKLPINENLTVHSVHPEGYFIGAAESGKKVHTFYTDIGETGIGDIFKRKGKYWCRQFISQDTLSPFRTEQDCPHFGQCGGCDLRHLTYERQQALKTLIAETLLSRSPNGFVVSPRLNRYRNYAAFNVEFGKTGFYKKMSRSLLDIFDCRLMDELIINELTQIHTIKETFEGEIRIKTCDGGVVRREYPKFVSKEATGETLVHAEKTIDGITYFVSPDTFFQSNDHILPDWLSVIERYVQTHHSSVRSIIDLYSGAGTISLRLARSVGHVIGIEQNPLSVMLARKSIAAMGFDTDAVRYETGDLHSHDIGALNADVLIVNPPRGGISENVTAFIREKKFNTIVYSSCNIATFARDVLALTDYDLTDYTIVDMFPQTFHFETVGLLTRKEG